VSTSETILRAGDVAVTLFPDDGGRVGQITVADQPLLIDVPAAGDREPKAWGAYPMAPWAGRIRAGRFTFAGAEHQLPINHEDGDGGPGFAHAIHGLVFDRRWDTDAATDTSWTGSCRLDWGFGGLVTHAVELDAGRLTMTLTVTSTGSDVPAEVGWHPWFLVPDHLDVALTQMYERDRYGLPTGELVTPRPGPWDDCFVVDGPVTLRYDRAAAPVVRLDADTDHWVIFSEPDDALCVEPQSGPPDAFNLPGRHHVVRPGEPLRRRFTISW
jgi:aldose 1-epimerase